MRGTMSAQRHNNAGETVDFWQVLPAAIALVFIVEGIMPFISPNRWSSVAHAHPPGHPNTVRNIGLGSMLFGVGLLYFVH